MLDAIIRGGHVIDPAQGIDGIKDIAVKNGHIVAPETNVEAIHEINAEGCYVFPGLIDGHTHSYFWGSGLGVQPDLFASAGVTTIVDAGTAGWSNYHAFHNTSIVNSIVRVKSLVAYNNSGQVELGENLSYDTSQIKRQKIRDVIEHYRGEVLGLKILFQREFIKDDPETCLEGLIEVAEECKCMITVHTTNPPIPVHDILKHLRAGDVYCHCYQGRGYTILNASGSVDNSVWAARKRGVLFDAANGTNNFAFSTAIPAIKSGFLPDIISSDNASNSFCWDRYAKNLPFVMSKYLALGMTLRDIVACTTEKPAAMLGMHGKIGTLSEGAIADITIMKLVPKHEVFWDSVKADTSAVKGNYILVPQMTFINGMPVYRLNSF